MPFFRRASAERERLVQTAREEATVHLQSRIQEREARIRENRERADVGTRYGWVYGQNPAENARRVLGLPDGPLSNNPEWFKLVAAYTLASPEQRNAMFLVLAGEFVRLRAERGDCVNHEGAR